MSKETRQRASEQQNHGTDGGGTQESGLAVERSEVDRLFAIAEKSFEALSEGNSREFLRSSEQTGGQ